MIGNLKKYIAKASFMAHIRVGFFGKMEKFS